MPLSGICKTCNSNRLIYTISEGSVKKYLGKTLELIEVEGVSTYVRDTIKLLERRIDSVFGKEATKQTGLGGFMNG
jgi:DNA polymerase II large subunit